MPRGLIILILLLLVGAYFFFSGGSPAKLKAPSLQVEASLTKGEEAYVASLEGKVIVPEGEYNVASVTVSLFVDGVKREEKTFKGGIMKGPADYPFSLNGDVPTSAKDAYFSVHARVVGDGKDLELEQKVPLAIPPAALLLRPPSIFLSISDITPAAASTRISGEVVFYNPNNVELTVTDISMRVGEKDVPLSVTKLPPGKETKATFTAILSEGNAPVLISGKVKGNGTTLSFSYSGTLFVPSYPLLPPVAELSAKVTDVSSKRITVVLSGKLHNPNKLSLVVQRLYVLAKNEEGLMQEVNVLENNVLLPESNISVSKTLYLDKSMSDARLEVRAKVNNQEYLLSTLPLAVLPITEFLEAPKISVEFNGTSGVCKAYIKIENPNDVDIDVNDLYARLTHNGSDYPQTFDAFTVEAESSETKTYEQSVVWADADNVVFLVRGTYGIKNLDVWVPFEYVVERKGCD